MQFLKGKEFLNYYELGLYLNSLGYELNLKDEKDINILDNIIQSLVIERKLNYLIYVNSLINVAIIKRATDTEKELFQGMANKWIEGYFIMEYETLKDFKFIEPNTDNENEFEYTFFPFKLYRDIEYNFDDSFKKPFEYDEVYYHLKFQCGEFDRKQLMYSREQLDNIFNKDLTKQLSIKITSLQDELLISNNRIRELESQQANQPSDTATDENKNSRNQDDKLIVAMALLLAEKSKQFTRGNKPNASQIGIAVNSIADFMLDKDDKYGLTTPDQRIRKALNNISELIKNS